MEYSVQGLAQLAGLSSRTLRYYDQIGLLKPCRISSSGYRIYGQEQVDRLQQILFYRELEVPLEQIRALLERPDFDRIEALEQHLLALKARHRRTEVLIATIKKTISSAKGEKIMSNKEKFAGLQKQRLADNEARYGKELRERYGEELMQAANARFGNMSQEQWEQGQVLEAQIADLLKIAVEKGDPAGSDAQTLCQCHGQWLRLFWPEGLYSKEIHLSLAEGYVADERYRQYYEQIVAGGAQFLLEALRVYNQE